MAYRGNLPFAPVGVPGMFNLRREIDRLFEDAFGGNPSSGGRSGAQGGQGGQSFTPAVDAREEEREIVLHMDLPGVRPDDVDISVENGLLTVRGQRHQQRKEGQEGRYQFVERSYGSFTRAFHLPPGVDESQISANFEHGELTIRVPKPQQPQPRRIHVGGAQTGGAQPGGQTGGAPVSGGQAQASVGSGPGAAPDGGSPRVENGTGGATSGATSGGVGGAPAGAGGSRVGSR
jgi:HSP20 family protein